MARASGDKATPISFSFDNSLLLEHYSNNIYESTSNLSAALVASPSASAVKPFTVKKDEKVCLSSSYSPSDMTNFPPGNRRVAQNDLSS